jgi:Putative neutral zinc metallopeptidase
LYDNVRLMASWGGTFSARLPVVHCLRLGRWAQFLLALGLAMAAAACGSARSSSSAAGASATAPATSTTPATSSTSTTATGSATTSAQTIEDDALARFPAVAPPATAQLPSPPTSPTVERSYLIALFDDAQSVWRREFEAAHLNYQPTRVKVFYSVTESACGRHESSGPFYCSGDSTVYLDTRFFTLFLREGASARPRWRTSSATRSAITFSVWSESPIVSKRPTGRIQAARTPTRSRASCRPTASPARRRGPPIHGAD